MRFLLSLLVAIAIGYAVLLAMIYWFQSHLVYFPDMGRELAGTPRDVGLEYEEVWLETPDGERLHAWFVPAPAPRGAVLLCHGNAGNISHRIDYLAMLHRLGYSSLVFDYRGFGRSSGRPSEQGTYRDGEAAWRHLTGARGFAPRRVALLGESLGAAVAARLATEHDTGALVIASAFTSVPDLGAEVYPFLPVRLLSRFRYDTRDMLARVRAPVLVAHSPQDEIVPYRHGRALFEAAREPKTFLQMRGGHNDGFLFVDEAWVQALGAFLDQHVAGAPGVGAPHGV